MPLSNRIRTSVKEVAEASAERSWRGSRPVDDHDVIEIRFEEAGRRFNELMTRVDELEAAADAMIKAWEQLPTGYHSPSIVQEWLVDKMKPAIDELRRLK